MIRIGTRSSQLALWQANTVANLLKKNGHNSEIVKIESLGDIVLNKPLYELGVTGIFTKSLDIALLNEDIDIAVHSLKDVPTQLPEGIKQAAILKRGNFNDVLVLKKDESFFENDSALIATGSLRRKAQWLHRYPNHTITGLRGNVNTRLQKLEDHNWDGAIFAAAGLERLKLLPSKDKHLKLDWMIPAPAQGAVMIVALGKNEALLEICQELNHEETALCVAIEREFLQVLEGGCTAPIGALATINESYCKFKGVLFSPDGKNKLEFNKTTTKEDIGDLGAFAANYILARGGKNLMRKNIILEKNIQVYSTKYLSKDQTMSLSPGIGSSMGDFISIKYKRIKPSIIKEPLKNIIFTSKNAVESLLYSFDASELDFTNIFCVGKRTKRLIEKKIGKVTHIESSAKKLATYLSTHLKDENYTFFCGDKRRDDLPEILSNKNIEVNEVVCYSTLLSSKKIEDKFKGILFYSPSGIESFLIENTANDRIAFCIGETSANKARKHFKTVIVSKTATVESVLSAVNDYYQNLNK